MRIKDDVGETTAAAGLLKGGERECFSSTCKLLLTHQTKTKTKVYTELKKGTKNTSTCKFRLF